MTSRNIHLTSYLGGADIAAVYRLVEAAASTGLFREVFPVRVPGELRIVALVLVSTDRGHDMDRMPQVAERMSGILSHDILIASAWQDTGAPGTGLPCSYLVRGGGQAVRGEVVREVPAIGPGAGTEGRTGAH